MNTGDTPYKSGHVLIDHVKKESKTLLPFLKNFLETLLSL